MFKNTRLVRVFISVSSLVIVVLTAWSISIFYDRIKADEREKMLILTEATKALVADDETSTEQSENNTSNSTTLSAYRELALKIQNSNTNIPGIIVDENGIITTTANIPEKIEKDSIKLYDYLDNIKSQNEPLPIKYKELIDFKLYYGNSEVLTQIKYYPLILFLIIILCVGLFYFFYTTSKESEKNKLWAGMAKETAHQIGTPLSSLVGWLEFFRAEGNIDPDYLLEIEKDIDRLHTITERFSKVGSHVKLDKMDIVQVTKDTFDYLKDRSSNLINFTLDIPEEPTFALLNKPLFSWTLENLVKNGIDAMKGKGDLKIEIVRTGSWIRVLVKDNGSGIPLNQFKSVFTPGYTTKTRGWGLGLSLAKRIVEDYHRGKIKVLFSEVGHGTTFEIKLKKL